MEADEELITLLGEIKAGDHIACIRLGGIFEHHGIYVGFVDGYHKVIHVKAPAKSLSSLISGAASSDKDCSICGFKPPKDGGRVVSSCLRCFSKGKRIYIIRYRVPLRPYTPNGEAEDLTTGKIMRGYRSKKLYRELNKGGKLFGHMIIPHNHEKLDVDNLVLISKYSSSRSPDEILQVAQSNYDVGKYNFVLNNCEHFIVYCITGEEHSIQAEKMIPNLIYNVAKKGYELLTNKGKEKMKEKRSKKYFGP